MSEALFKADGSPAPEGVPVQLNAKGKPFCVVYSPCSRCGGAGYLPYQVEGGKCFRCFAVNSKRYEKVVYKLYSAEKAGKMVAAKAAKAEKKAAKFKAEQDAAVARLKAQVGEEVFAYCEYLQNRSAEGKPVWNSSFAMDVFQKGFRWELSVAQVEALKSAVARLKEAEERREAKVEFGQWLGVVGRKSVFDLEVKNVFSFQSEFGLVFVYKMEDSFGNEVVYKGRSSKFDPAKGDKVKFEAMVKKHDEYKGVKQSVVKFPKMLEHVPAGKEEAGVDEAQSGQ